MSIYEYAYRYIHIHSLSTHQHTDTDTYLHTHRVDTSPIWNSAIQRPHLIYPEHSREQGSKQKRHLSSQVKGLKSPCTKAHALNASAKPEGPDSELTYFNFIHNSNTLGPMRRLTRICYAGYSRNCGLVPARMTDNGFMARGGEIMSQVDTYTRGSLREGHLSQP